MNLMNLLRRFSEWFGKRTTDQKITITGLFITAMSSILIPVIFHIFSSSNPSETKPSNVTSPVINQAPSSNSEINYNTTTNIIKGADPRDIEVYLKKLKSKTKEERRKEVDALYYSREIDLSLKDTLYTVIDYIDQNVKETTQNINTYRQEGRAKLASSLETMNSDFIDADINEAEAIQKSQTIKTPADQAVIYTNVGNKLTVIRRYEEAEVNYKNAIDLFEQSHLTSDPDYIVALNNLGQLYYMQGKYDLAESFYKKALETDTDVMGIKKSEHAVSLNNLADLYRVLGKYDLAEPLYKEALEIKKDSLGENHPDYAKTLDNWAQLLRVQGKYDVAEPMIKKALEIFKKTYGKKNPDYAIALNNLALLYDVQGQYDLAGPLYAEALRIARSTLGTDHPNTIIIQNNYREFQKAKLNRNG